MGAPFGFAHHKILTDSQGKLYILMVMVDITEQLALTRKVETQRQRLENIIEGPRLGTWEWNMQTGEALFNDRWADMAGDYALKEFTSIIAQNLRPYDLLGRYCRQF